MPDYIKITGARQHNLKNIDVKIPKHQLVVLTGMSGSGKSSLAFDTLYAEGQRRYVESLSSYARQFLGVMEKPDVDHIEGLSPAISIDQKTTSHNPRSTVGTITEIYDYLRLLFARVGHPHCPNCGREISTQTVDQIVDHIFTRLEQKYGGQPIRFMIMSPIVRERKGEFSNLLENIEKKGYLRVRIDGTMMSVDEEISLIKTNKHSIDVVIDRFVMGGEVLKDVATRKDFRTRLVTAIEEAIKLSDGYVIASYVNDAGLSFPDKPKEMDDVLFSEKFACSYCGISIPEVEPRLFSFNAPQGACPNCNGLGKLLKIDPKRILAPALTLTEGAVIPFARMMETDTWWSRLIKEVVEDYGFDFRKTAYQDFSDELKEVLLNGSTKVYHVKGTNREGYQTQIHEAFEGFVKNLERRYGETDSEYIRKEIERFMHKEVCPECHGRRLKPEALSVHIAGRNISEVTELAIVKALAWMRHLIPEVLSEKEKTIGTSIINEIVTRLDFLSSVGLNYLSLDRESSTLAGGEAQRIRLASQIGTGLTGVLYVLDEPTIGLHQRDNHLLIETLKSLRDKDNSVVVVEHDRDVIMSADYVLDFGPRAGKNGGTVIAEGTPEELKKDPNSITGKYISNQKKVSRKSVSELPNEWITVFGAKMHNLKNINADFPLNRLVCITGLSGSGKSTLLHDTLYNNLARELGYAIDGIPGDIDSIEIPAKVKRISLIDQSPIGRTPRSNPATYTKIFDQIRNIFAETADAKVRGYKLGRFSFNVRGGRCEACRGEGQIKIEMQFLPDVYVTCDVCHGRRYNEETLEVKYRDKNIAEILDMSVDEAYDFFYAHKQLQYKLQTLKEVGLGYIDLGQPAPTLSGGEAQRVKLARELSIRSNDHTVYLLDEPTTGLHFEDIQKLLNVLGRLVEQNNTVILIEHNLDIIKNCDWLIDLGPEGGEFGGEVVTEGPPAQVAKHPKSWTGKFLKEEL